MRIDMHVHTDKYSYCAHNSPEEMVEAAITAGLDGLVLTDHDYFWHEEEARELQRKYPQIRVFRGIEVSTAEGHCLVYGIHSDDKFYINMPLSELVSIVHEQNGVAVVAHPGRYGDDLPEEIFSSGLDAVEVNSLNCRRYMGSSMERIIETLNIPSIAGSDAHQALFLSMGVYATEFRGKIRTEEDIASAIRKHLCHVYRNETRIHQLNNRIDAQVGVKQGKRMRLL